MRITHALRCTTAIATSAAGAAFWTVNLFASQASLDAYRADSRVFPADKARATLVSTAVLQTLGWTNVVATSSPPGTVTLSDGTLGYGAHNLLTCSEGFATNWGFTAGSNTKGQTDSAGGTKGVRIWGAGNVRMQQNAAYPASGKTVTVLARVRATSANVLFRLWATHADVADYFSPDQTATASWQWFAFTRSMTVAAGGLSAGVAEQSTAGGGTDILIDAMVLVYGTETAAQYPDRYVPTTSAAVFAPRLTFDRGAGSNYQAYSADLTQWTTRGTTVISAASVRANGVTMSPVSVDVIGTNDVYRFSSGLPLATGARCDPAFWIEKISTTGTIKVYNPQANTNGNWSIDLSKVPSGPQWISRGHPAVTITTEFTSANGAADGAGLQIGSASGTLSFYIAASLQAQAIHGPTYLRTTTAALTTAGTPRSQNLFTYSDMTGDSYTGLGLTNTLTSGYRVLAVSSGGTYRGWYRSAGMLTNQVAGCVYTVQLKLRAGTVAGASVSFWNGSAENCSAARVLSGPGTVATTSTRASFSSLSASVDTVVEVSGVGGSPLIYVSSDPSLAANIGDSISYKEADCWEGNASLAFTPATGTPYSEYPQAGLLREVARTNLAKQSQTFDNASWTKAGAATVTAASRIAPDGTNTGYLFAASSAGDLDQTITVSASTAYVLSFYAVASGAGVTGYEIYDVTHGADIVAPTSYAGQINSAIWTRVSVAFTTPAGCTSIQIVPAVRVSGAAAVYIWGAQLEAGAFPTSYIPTTTAAVARDADLIRPPTSYINDTAQTTVVEFVPAAITGSSQSLMVRYPNGAVLYIDTGGQASIYDGVGTKSSANIATAGVINRAASRYSSAGKAISLNGGTVASGSSAATQPGSGQPIGIGDDGTTGVVYSGLITRISIATRAANDADLQAASAGGR